MCYCSEINLQPQTVICSVCEVGERVQLEWKIEDALGDT